MSTKVLLDTDIGTDIDDAVCLAYLLANPACDLLGITTVTGEAVERAKMASAMCRVAGVNVPIYPGCQDPFLVKQRQTNASQAVALSKWAHDSDFPQGQAISFLRDTIRANPGEIVLLAIGPMTNIGLLFTMDPEIPSLLKGLVLMCGKFAGAMPVSGVCRYCEWNAMCDPHATAVVYKHAVKSHRSIGLDVTMQVTMSADEVRQRFQVPLLKPVLDFAEVWFEHTKRITFHDPLAAVTIFDDNVCEFRRGNVSVELASPDLAGFTIWHGDDEKGAHEAAFSVDVDRFFDNFFGVFQGS